MRLLWCLVLSAWCLALGRGKAWQPPVPRNSQVQVARQFLRAALRGDEAVAFGRVAPEVRRALGIAGFARAVQALEERGQVRGADIELYKLGFRLEEKGAGRPFVAYAWAADSVLRGKREWLEVTFRDTAARAVWGWAVRRR